MNEKLFWAGKRQRRFDIERIYENEEFIERSAVFKHVLEQRIFTGMRFFVVVRLAVMAIRATGFGRTKGAVAASMVNVYR
mgnify:CR=1 FL=1